MTTPQSTIATLTPNSCIGSGPFYTVTYAKPDPWTWGQKGADIDGEAIHDNFGSSVSLSNDGSIVAIGGHSNDGAFFNAGHVRVYEYSGSIWSQKGADIEGEASGDKSGYSVSLSDDGLTVAIGAYANDDGGNNAGQVKVCEWNSGTSAWDQKGSNIDGAAADDFSGGSVSLSSDGNTVAIGADQSGGVNAGYVRVYEYNSGTSAWGLKGASIDGEASGDYSGHSVSLNGSGDIVAIGAYGNDGPSVTDNGHVRVYEYDSGTSSWGQKGSDIDGKSPDDNSGYSVSLSDDGLTVAIGAPRRGRGASGPGPYIGYVSVYEWGGSDWVQKGYDIAGEASGDYTGHSVSLSDDGSLVAIGAPYNDGGAGNAGHVRVYEYQSCSGWVQKGSDIDDNEITDWSGWSVSLASDGSIRPEQ